MSIKELVIKNLIALRESRGMKPAHLAQKTGLQKSMIHYVESGGERSNTSIEKLELFAKGLDVPVWVLFLDESMVHHPETAREWYNLFCQLNDSDKLKTISYMQGLANQRKIV